MQSKQQKQIQISEGFSMDFHHDVGYYQQQIKTRYVLDDVSDDSKCPQTMEIRRVK
jgi:hypothetical protein